MMEQPDSLRKTFESEMSTMDEVSNLISDKDKIYLIGCGSSISTCYSVRDAIRMSSTNIDIEVYTGYEFYYNKKLVENENTIAIFTSQSGDITQLACLYQILFTASDYEAKDELLAQLAQMPDIIEQLLKTTEYSNRLLAEDFKKEDIFYCLGSGPNFGLAYKLAMTMLMEGAIKHACPEYSAEFRHGLIERAEKGVPIIFLRSDFESDEITDKAIDFSENLKLKSIIYELKDYADVDKLLSPFVLVIPLEWFIYYLAHYNGEDPGATRHIGKVRY